MKNTPAILIIVTVFSLTACSNRELILTDEVAYYSTDDSVSVMTLFHKVTDSTFLSSATLKNDTAHYELPVPISTPAADYPDSRAVFNMAGDTQVKMWVTKEGKVKRAYILKSSDYAFNKASLEAAMKWTFRPALKNGVPTSYWVTVPFMFRMRSR